MMDSFTEAVEVENLVVIKVRGDINIQSSPCLRQSLTPHYHGKKGIIVDLSRVSTMDCSGIATLVEGLQWSRKSQKPFALTGINSQVRGIFSLTKVDDLFTILSGKPKE